MNALTAQPIVTVDIVLLTLQENELCAALLQRARPPNEGEWTLPGGFVHIDTDEDALAAATRILRTKAGIDSPYLEQLQTFASRHRDSRGWSVSIAYYALVPAAAASDALKWRPVDSIRSLPFDHRDILRAAVERVRSKTAYSSLPVHLMPPTFTLSELQKVYEALLKTDLDKRGFRRRIEELDVVEPAPAQPTTRGAHRPAQLYRLKRKASNTVAMAERNLSR
ncbi:NUDIX hydrolase [Peristeroidobacter soli]|uniref:NUDIX hydrolase n=1 Tax=Peristeroidobacter soli TaxID=2497877 RepID=UPI001C376213|nr:NUDIX domain-containing protein [Peristeroidobacter soli]